MASAAIVEECDDALMISDDGTIIRTAVSGINLYGRVTQGVNIMTVPEGVKVISLATTLENEEEEPPAAEETPGPETDSTEESTTV